MSFGCLRITSRTGWRASFLPADRAANFGVSRIPIRMYRPTPTRTMLRRNGIRQPHAKNDSPDILLNSSTTKVARKRPTGRPSCGIDAMKPRYLSVRPHSIASSTEPPHSPPTPMPWTKRSTVSAIAPQIPMTA